MILIQHQLSFLVPRFEIGRIKYHSSVACCERSKLLPYSYQAMHFVEHVDTSGKLATCIVPPLGAPPLGSDHARPAIVGGCIVKVPKVWVIDEYIRSRRQIDGPQRDGPSPAEMECEGESDANYREKGASPGQLGSMRLLEFCHAVLEMR